MIRRRAVFRFPKHLLPVERSKDPDVVARAFTPAVEGHYRSVAIAEAIAKARADMAAAGKIEPKRQPRKARVENALKRKTKPGPKALKTKARKGKAK